MKKIKKFRVQPRPSYVLKALKTLASNTQVTPELEKAVETEINHAQEYLSTAALYNTFGPDELPDWAKPLAETTREKGGKPVAVTFYVGTIGTGLEGELGDALTRGEALRSQILTSVGEESAEQVINFVHRLVSDEAKEESCELSERNPASEESLQRNILGVLEADKISIQLDNVGHLTPRFSRAGYLLWWPPAKKGK